MSAIPAETAHLIDQRVRWLDSELEEVLSSSSQDLDLYRWARYHLGWLDAGLQPMPDAERRKHGGKRLRGVLTLLAAEGVGGSGATAAPAGAAIELIHNFSLVHDDIEDNDAERRHRPTVWKLWGVPHAINVGSNMQALVDAAILRLAGQLESDIVVRALRVVTGAVLRMTEGQYLDMAAEGAAEMSLESYFRMTGGKTAALTEAALTVGGLVGGGNEEQVRELGRFGWSFGLAFQCRDDYLGVWGEPKLTGKPVGSDILRGKRSLPVVHALSAAPAETSQGARLRSALESRDVPQVLRLLDELGTADFVREKVAEHTGGALTALERARLHPPYGKAVRDIADYALGRES